MVRWYWNGRMDMVGVSTWFSIYSACHNYRYRYEGLMGPFKNESQKKSSKKEMEKGEKKNEKNFYFTTDVKQDQ